MFKVNKLETSLNKEDARTGKKKEETEASYIQLFQTPSKIIYYFTANH